ncbi:PQQ-binding-like beta-propeller repeat protein [Phenylobacterium sp. J426]|uniref:outer membrane protein assembly factor BamB family protein n=1 Tax=Phenylobacterium sp. J426 TaxID=2898439 RepID=UPI002151D7D9|nr:PQQ-binding-like beta-propeller repeat protein [Phenylobacterium sp. J426]MCR5876232.1 PQQ-binding-like beta-propeller repeat protein [Phenylobacterium sp. J426]
MLGGSAYYVLAGLGLLASGVLLMRRRLLGVWLYVAVYILTLAWAAWEVGLDGWGLVPWVVAPGVLLVALAFCVPALRSGGRARVAPLAAGGVFIASLALLGLLITAQGAPVGPGAREVSRPLTGAGEPAADWPAYGGGYDARRFSTLAQITPENVARLERVWTYRTRDLPSDAAEGKYAAETTPLKVGDSLYLCSAKNVLIALDAANGRERWRYDPKVPDDAIPYSASCRGVSYYRAPALDWSAACAARIIQGTLDARLIAVDARTGQPCPDFGTNGQVSLLTGIGRTTPGYVAVTSPPTIVRGVAVIGHQVLDGQRRDAPSGVVRGYDAVTGELLWAWDLARPDRKGLPPEGESYTRGTPNMWTIASGDEALGLVYLPMGNSAVDYYGGTRSAAENAYATSLVALDVTTGSVAWRFQTVRYDVWDYDLGSQATLVDFPTAAGVTPALVLPSKQGDIYILDRRTGRPLTPVEERPVPRGGVEPQRLSPTQPFSRFHTLRQPDLTERDMWGMSPLDQLWCRIQFRRAAYEGIYTPPTLDRRWIQYPGYNGGSDWGGVAVDPSRGIIVANYNDTPNYNRLITRQEAEKRKLQPLDVPGAEGGEASSSVPQAGVPYAIDLNAGWRVPFTKLLCKRPPYGGIRAIELATGRTLWDRPLGTARKNGPFGLPSWLPLAIGTPNNGGRWSPPRG